jgi:nucleoside-diphosphate-sugar epimerase
MKKQKLLITGGNGFVGRNVINHILKNNLDLEIYNYGRSAVGEERVVNVSCDAETFDFHSVNTEFDYIIHLLALSNNAYCSDFEYAQKINIEFTKKVLEFARSQKKLKKLIHLSSIITYENTEVPPVRENAKLYFNYNTYSFTKGVAENYVNYYREKLGVPTIIFRLSNIYGPYQKFIDSPFLVPSKIMQGLNEGKIEVSSLSPKRDWIYSEDAAEAIVKSLDTDFTGILNLGNGMGSSVSEIVEVIAKNLNVPFSSKDLPTTGPINFYCDISAITKVLPWKPTTGLREGLEKTITYIKENAVK